MTVVREPETDLVMVDAGKVVVKESVSIETAKGSQQSLLKEKQ